MPHSIQRLTTVNSKFWETNRNLAEPQRIVYCPQGIFSRTFARQSDQFKRDFCWSDHIFYDLGPWSDSYFEVWLRCVNVWSSLTDKSTLAKIWLVACRHQAFLNQILNQIWNAKTWKNNRAPLLCYFKLCASFHWHRWIQTGVTVWKHLIWVKIDDFFSRVTLKFDVWPWKTIGHLFYATSSFVHHFVAIGEFKLELQSGNAQSRSNSTILRAVWPWNLTDDLEKQ